MENMAQSAGDEKMKLSLKPLLLAIVGTFLLQLWLCYFFSFGSVIPMTNDIIPANCWEFRFHFKRFQVSEEQCIPGGSHLVLNDSGQVILHRDYWDTADLYEKLPLLGGVMRWLKRQARK